MLQLTAADHRGWRELKAAPRVVELFARAPGYGALSSVAKDNIYGFGPRGFLFTSPWVVTRSTVRHPAVVLLTASGEGFELAVDGRVLRHDAVAIAPLTRRGLCAVDVPLLSVHIDAPHPRFGAFRGIGPPGVLPLDRRRFDRFDRDLLHAYQGCLARDEAETLFEALVETAAGELPEPRSPDPHADVVGAFLLENSGCSLGDLARELEVSYTSASHIFARVMGMSLPSFRQRLKCMRASERLHLDMPLTEVAQEAGFADSSHLARTWQRSYGHSPSYARDRAHVRVFCGDSWARSRAPLQRSEPAAADHKVLTGSHRTRW